MGKHKTKKFEPTPDPPSDKIEDKPEAKAPPTESKAQEITPPPKVSMAIDKDIKKQLDKLFWIRVIIAATAGVVATIIFEPITGEERRWASILFMVIIFIGTAMLGKMMGITLPKSDRKKIVTTGIGSFVFIYLFAWILSYTLLNVTEKNPFGTVDI